MNISIILMQFPAPSETFASNDLRVMKSLGININVYTMKNKHLDSEIFLHERDISDIPINHNSFLKNICGLFILVVHPIILYKILKYIFFKDQQKIINYIKLILLLPSSFYILNELKKKSPDIVHLFWGHYPSIVGLLIKEFKLDIKVTMFLGAYDLEYNLGITKELVKQCDKLFTHSKGNKKLLLNRYQLNENKIVVCYRGVNIDKFVTEKKSVKKEENSFLTIGRLIDVKAQSDVILAFSKIKKFLPTATLKVIGDGPDKEKLLLLVDKLKLNNSVEFFGHISQDKLFQYLQQTEYFLFMSVHDGERLPNSLKEAMISENICISTKTKDIEELVENKIDGFLVDYHDINNVVSIVKKINTDIARKNKIKLNAKNKIIKSFNVKVSIEKMIQKWFEIIKEERK